MSEMDVDNPMLQIFQKLETDEKGFQAQCENLAKDVIENTRSIVQLVEDLGVYLVDTIVDNREYGTRILSTIIAALPEDFLSSTQLNFICTFYTDRLKDNHKVVPAVLKGILALSRHKHVPEGAFAKILSALFHNVPCQQQQQHDRFVIYSIFKNMLENRENELKAIGMDLVYGVITAMDSERDPRNLLFLFNWLPKFLENIPLGHLNEEMFEVISCYFPVDFRVPSQDSNGISRDALAEALGPCLCATPAFTEFCIPLALEKLDSNLRIAKLDSLKLLFLGCKTFSTDIYFLHATEIWSLIQKEILTGTDQELELECLSTLTAVFRKLSSLGNPYVNMLGDVVENLKGNLRPESKLFEESAKILQSAAKASEISSKQVINEVVPLLTNVFNITENVQNKVKILKILIDFVKTYCEVVTYDLTTSEHLNLIPNLCLKASIDDNDEIRVVGLESLTATSKSLPLKLRETLYENLKIYLTAPQNPQPRQAFLKCLKTLSQDYPDEILNLITTTPTTNLQIYLDSLTALSNLPHFSSTILQIILKNLIDTNSSNVAISALKNVVEAEDCNNNIFVYLNEDNVVCRLCEFVLRNLDVVDVEFLRNTSIVLKEIVRKQGFEEQERTIRENLYKVMKLFEGKEEVVVFLLNGLLVCLRREVLAKFDSFCEDILRVCLKSQGIVQATAVELLGNVVNKMTDVDGVLVKIEEKCDGCLRNEENVKCVSDAIAWITKALVMRGHNDSKKWIMKLIGLLETNEFAAIGFKTVMSDSYDSMSSKSFCNIRLLYKQMFFTIATDALVTMNTKNANYLLTVGYLLEEVPKPVLKMQFEKVIKLILLCLDNCQNSTALVSVLTTLHSFGNNQDEMIEKYVEELLPRILKLTRFKQAMNVRILAIKCVENYASGFTLYKVLPHKVEVLTTLGECLDDHKRLVRRQAVEARMKWYLLDAPI